LMRWTTSFERWHAKRRAAVPHPPWASLIAKVRRQQKSQPNEASTREKKVKGRKRHILVDVCGLLLAVSVTPASVQDRDGAVPLIRGARTAFPTISKILVDGAYVAAVIDAAQAETGIAVEVTKRNEQVKGFVPVRKRWVVERTFGWMGRFRRTSKDYERYCATEEYVFKWVMIAILLRRLRPGPAGLSCSLQMRHAA
jgi:transposase